VPDAHGVPPFGSMLRIILGIHGAARGLAALLKGFTSSLRTGCPARLVSR
jgi:hypothetical protein